MTIPMPEPVAFAAGGHPNHLCSRAQYNSMLGKNRIKFDVPLITTAQAEAYKDACVREALGWQPIATAPKDFVTEFDGWNGERVTNVIWAHPEYEAKGEYAFCQSVYEHNHGWTMERVRGLTHWLPLPPPPKD